MPEATPGQTQTPLPTLTAAQVTEQIARVDTARYLLSRRNKWARRTLRGLKITVRNHGTMSVDKWLRLYVDPRFVSTQTDSQLLGDLWHEANHILRHHHDRLGFGDEMTRTDHMAANCGADCEINQDLLTQGFELPEWVVTPDNLELPEGETAEHYAATLKGRWAKEDAERQRQAQREQRDRQDDDGNADDDDSDEYGDDDGDPDGYDEQYDDRDTPPQDSDGDPQGDGDPQPGDGDPQPGDGDPVPGDGPPQPGDSPGGDGGGAGGGPQTTPSSPGTTPGGGLGGDRTTPGGDAPGEGDPTDGPPPPGRPNPQCGSGSGGEALDEDPEPDGNVKARVDREQRRQAEDIIEQVEQQDGGSYSKVGAETYKAAIEYIGKPRHDWRKTMATVIRNAFEKAMDDSEESTFRRPSRRAVAMPDVRLPSGYRPIPVLWTIIDVSGSMNKPKVEAALREMHGILDRLAMPVFQGVAWNTTLVHERPVSTHADIAPLVEYVGGGTSMVAAITYAAEHGAEVIVCLTDADCHWTGLEPWKARPLIIGGIARKKARELPKWAKVVDLEEEA